MRLASRLAVRGLVLAAGLLLAGEGRGQKDQPATKLPADLKEMSDLERQTWQALTDRDAKAIKELWAEDFVGILSTGIRRTKADVLSTLADLTIRAATLRDVRLTKLDANVAMLNYKLERTSSFQGKELPSSCLVSSVWVRRGSRWQVMLYQETPIEK
jgi:hypothetical protein